MLLQKTLVDFETSLGCVQIVGRGLLNTVASLRYIVGFSWEELHCVLNGNIKEIAESAAEFRQEFIAIMSYSMTGNKPYRAVESCLYIYKGGTDLILNISIEFILAWNTRSDRVHCDLPSAETSSFISVVFFKNEKEMTSLHL